MARYTEDPRYWSGYEGYRDGLSDEEYGWTQAGPDDILNGDWMDWIVSANRRKLDPKKAARLIYSALNRGYGTYEIDVFGTNGTLNAQVHNLRKRYEQLKGHTNPRPRSASQSEKAYYQEMFDELGRLERESEKAYNAYTAKRKKDEAEKVKASKGMSLEEREALARGAAKILQKGERWLRGVIKPSDQKTPVAPLETAPAPTPVVAPAPAPEEEPKRGVRQPPRTTAAPNDPIGFMAGTWRKSSFGDNLTANELKEYDKAKGKNPVFSDTSGEDYDSLVGHIPAPKDRLRNDYTNRVGEGKFRHELYDTAIGRKIDPRAFLKLSDEDQAGVVFSAKPSGTLDERDMGAVDQTGRMRVIDPSKELNEAGGYKYDPYTRKLYRTLREMGLYMVETDSGALLPARIDEQGKIQITNLNGLSYDVEGDNYRVVNRTPIQSRFVPKRGVTEADMFDAAERGMSSKHYNPALANAFWRRANSGGFAKAPLTDQQRTMMGDMKMRNLYNAASLGQTGAAQMELADRANGTYTGMREQLMYDTGYGRGPGLNPQRIAFDQAQARYKAEMKRNELETKIRAQQLAQLAMTDPSTTKDGNIKALAEQNGNGTKQAKPIDPSKII